ncbi:MAG: YlmC/YmxH family sporulation protein [Clostridia bacterium]
MVNKDYTFCELREKEVVNTVDGRRLGRIVDISFTCRGQIFGIIVPGCKKLLRNLSSNDAIFIPWRNICKIGEDVILVELCGAQSTRILSEDEPPPENEET